MPTILVTGGAGYIGSHACKHLAAHGHRVVVVDDLSRGHADAVRWGPLERGDLGDRGFLAEVFRRHRPDAVMHFAALAYVGESMREPGAYFRVNVAGSAALLDAMRDAGCRNLVFSSTCATYGEPEAMPITEETPQRPVNPYGESKLMVERMIAWHARIHGLAAARLRYFNVAGCDPDGEIGERHDPETHLVPLAIAAALGQGPPLRVFGTDYPTPDGTAVRDYIHVLDLVAAHRAALDRLLAGGRDLVCNLGTGVGSSVRQVIDAVGRAAGRPVPHVIAERRAGDPPVLVASARRAADELGWSARFDLDDMVRHAVRWHAAAPPGG